MGIPEVEFFSFENALSYRQNLEEAAKSSVLVDFLNRKHYGLSLRIFEAIGLDKKLITTNPTIVHYDFITRTICSTGMEATLTKLKDLPDLAVCTACPRPEAQIQLQQLDQLRI